MNALGKRTCLAIAGAAGDDNSVKKAGDGCGVEDFDVLGFDILKGVDNKKLQAGEVGIQIVAPNRQMLNRVSGA